MHSTHNSQIVKWDSAVPPELCRRQELSEAGFYASIAVMPVCPAGAAVHEWALARLASSNRLVVIISSFLGMLGEPNYRRR